MSLTRALFISIIVMAVIAAFLCILQIWTNIIPWGTFIKIIITFVILTVLAGLVIALKADLGSKKTLKDENYLD